MKYCIIDNFLSLEDHKKIKDVMMSPHFPWYYNNSVTYENNDDELNYYFTHYFLNDDHLKSPFFDAILPIINKINIKKLIRIKGNLYPNINKDSENVNHADYNYSNFGAVYSINTNNGATILFDEESNHEFVVQSVQNRIVFFEGNKLHRSKHCTDEKVRVNVNLNFLDFTGETT